MFCPCIGFISDKYRVSQKVDKNGEQCIVDINVCTGGDLCSHLSNFSETPSMKVGFDVRISPI